MSHRANRTITTHAAKHTTAPTRAERCELCSTSPSAVTPCAHSLIPVAYSVLMRPATTTATARTVTEDVRDFGMLGRHAKAGQIECIAFGDNGVFVGDGLVVPGGVDIERGIEGLLHADLFLES